MRAVRCSICCQNFTCGMLTGGAGLSTCGLSPQLSAWWRWVRGSTLAWLAVATIHVMSGWYLLGGLTGTSQVQGLGPGSLLVASDLIRSGIFSRSVVLLVEHSRWGAQGFVINAPISAATGTLHGGPVHRSTYRANIYSNDEWAKMVGATRVLEGVWWKELRRRESVLFDGEEYPHQGSGALLRLEGYAGWAPQQLEGEISHGAWYVANGTRELVFGDTGDLWRRLIGDLALHGDSLAAATAVSTSCSEDGEDDRDPEDAEVLTFFEAQFDDVD